MINIRYVTKHYSLFNTHFLNCARHRIKGWDTKVKITPSLLTQTPGQQPLVCTEWGQELGEHSLWSRGMEAECWNQKGCAEKNLNSTWPSKCHYVCLGVDWRAYKWRPAWGISQPDCIWISGMACGKLQFFRYSRIFLMHIEDYKPLFQEMSRSLDGQRDMKWKWHHEGDVEGTDMAQLLDR